MKKFVDGNYIEMTIEEIAELKDKVIAEVPSLLERVEAIEAAILEGVLLGD